MELLKEYMKVVSGNKPETIFMILDREANEMLSQFIGMPLTGRTKERMVAGMSDIMMRHYREKDVEQVRVGMRTDDSISAIFSLPGDDIRYEQVVYIGDL